MTQPTYAELKEAADRLAGALGEAIELLEAAHESISSVSDHYDPADMKASQGRRKGIDDLRETLAAYESR